MPRPAGHRRRSARATAAARGSDARHGISIRLEVVTDPERHLVRGARRRKPLLAATAAARRLTDTLDDLERWLALRQPPVH